MGVTEYVFDFRAEDMDRQKILVSLRTDFLLTKYHLCGSIYPYETVFSQEAVWMSSLRPKQGGLRVAVNLGNF